MSDAVSTQFAWEITEPAQPDLTPVAPTIANRTSDAVSTQFAWEITEPAQPDLTPVAPTIANRTSQAGVSIGTVTLPQGSGGDPPLSYSAGGLPPGLSFTSSTRRVTGMPSAAGTYQVTYRVTDDDGDSDSETFTWTITASLSMSPSAHLRCLLKVWNTTLSLASVDGVTSTTETTPQAIACQTHFYNLYRAMLDLGEWTWAIHRAVVQGVYDRDDLPEVDYRYELPIDYYGYGDTGFTAGSEDRGRVRPLSIVRPRPAETAGPMMTAVSQPESQVQYNEEGPYLLTDYSATERPDPLGNWLPSLTLRFIATVDICHATGTFVEALQGLLGAVMARKFRRQAGMVQDLLAYGQAQLRIAFETLPNPVDWRAITFTNIGDVAVQPEIRR